MSHGAQPCKLNLSTDHFFLMQLARYMPYRMVPHTLPKGLTPTPQKHKPHPLHKDSTVLAFSPSGPSWSFLYPMTLLSSSIHFIISGTVRVQ